MSYGAYSTSRSAASSSSGNSARDDKVLSVTEAVTLAKNALESIVISVVGEVSEVSVKPGYKAAYFTIKDSSAKGSSSVLPCKMWNNRYNASGVTLEIGKLVQLTGRFSFYAEKGRMNFDAFTISLAGEGDLRKRIDDLARKLQAEGLLDPSRKRPIPKFPSKIGVVTSPRGAAIIDVLRTLRRRYPIAEVFVAGVPVEGANAARAIVDGIKCVYDAGVEVILVVRGGGSFEDLMPFNDERLARTIAACPTPIVTGIGHHNDNSIADMVSDLRASTPGTAAEAVTPSREEIDELVEVRTRAMLNAVERRLAQNDMRLKSLSSRPLFVDQMFLTGEYAQTLDFKADKLSHAIPVGLQRDAAALSHAQTRLASALPRTLSDNASAVDKLAIRMKHAGGAIVRPYENAFALKASRLDDLSPLAVISRGYSIARDADGRVVKSVSEVNEADSLEVLVSDGVISCEVTGASSSAASFAPKDD